MNIDITREPSRTDAPVADHRDAEILFTAGDSVLGTVLVARGPRGICAILIGSEAGALTADLASQFPAGTLTRNDRELATDLEKIVGFIATPDRGLDLALDIHGTPFQRRVWDALCAIPCGRTVTYAALARRIGEPGAVRAVANACAANALALAIPCHRVIRSNGTLAGYRWGVERKRAMLAREMLAGVAPAASQ
jgi:methylated-DNA-[protein]-cysteine S-methyltransferase/AraC family transcriptional regulator of adaptative response/methylated-DNA-[protein]-cysteine methyltransferase